MPFSNATKSFLISISAVPITYALNGILSLLGKDKNTPFYNFVIVLAILIAVLIGTISFTNKSPGSRRRDNLDFYVFSLLAFTSVASFITGLELDGMISGFMGFFLKGVEPYLRSSHGVMICYWHGTGMYAMYLMILAAITWNTSYQEVFLYWLGSISNSLIVLLLSVAVGKHGLTLGYFIYVCFAIIPPLIAFRIKWKNDYTIMKKKSLRKRPFDIILIVYLIFAIFLAIFRVVAVLECKLSLPQMYISKIEPYLQVEEPAPFPKIQMLVYFFYYIPLYVLILYGLINPTFTWMPFLRLIHAGASIQAQITHIGASLHPRTPYVQRVPQEFYPRLIFWVINLSLVLVPQLMAFWCSDSVDIFPPEPKLSKEVKDKPE